MINQQHLIHLTHRIPEAFAVRAVLQGVGVPEPGRGVRGRGRRRRHHRRRRQQRPGAAPHALAQERRDLRALGQVQARPGRAGGAAQRHAPRQLRPEESAGGGRQGPEQRAVPQGAAQRPEECRARRPQGAAQGGRAGDRHAGPARQARL